MKLTTGNLCVSDELISEFMGNDSITSAILNSDNQLDWGLLMKVVEKIENTTVEGYKYIKPSSIEWIEDKEYTVDLTFTVEMKGKQCMINVDCTPQYMGTTHDYFDSYDCRNKSKIEAVWNTITQFVKWYNIQIKK